MSCTWLTPGEAAERIKVTKSSVYRWLRMGQLKGHVTPGGQVRICEADLDLAERKLDGSHN